MTTTLTGYAAIAFASHFGLDLNKYTDPTEGTCVVDIDTARAIAKEDPSLVWIEAPAFDAERMTASVAAVGNDGSRPVVWGLGTSNEMAFADALRQDEFEPDDAAFLRLEPCDAATQERVQHGDVSWA